jgi:hypothetical protein
VCVLHALFQPHMQGSPDIVATPPISPINKEVDSIIEEEIRSGTVHAGDLVAADQQIIEDLTLAEWTEEINDINKLLPYAQLNKLWLVSTEINWIVHKEITSMCMCKHTQIHTNHIFFYL